MNNIHIQPSIIECKIGLCQQRWLCNLYQNIYVNTNHMSIFCSKSIKNNLGTSRVVNESITKGMPLIGTTPNML